MHGARRVLFIDIATSTSEINIWATSDLNQIPCQNDTCKRLNPELKGNTENTFPTEEGANRIGQSSFHEKYKKCPCRVYTEIIQTKPSAEKQKYGELDPDRRLRNISSTEKNEFKGSTREACCSDPKQSRNTINDPPVSSTISEKVIHETSDWTSGTNYRKQPEIRPREPNINKDRNADPNISKVSSLEQPRKLESHSKEKIYYPNAPGTVGRYSSASTLGNDYKTNIIDKDSRIIQKRNYDDTSGSTYTASEKVIQESPDRTGYTNYRKQPDIRPRETDISKNRNADPYISKVSSLEHTRKLDSYSKEKIYYPNAPGTVGHQSYVSKLGNYYKTNIIDIESPSTQKKIFDDTSRSRRLADGIQACCTDTKQNRNAISNPRICSTISEKVIQETPAWTNCTNYRKQPGIRPRETTDIGKNRNADSCISKVSSVEQTRKLDSHSKEKLHYPNASGTVDHRGPATTVGKDYRTNTIDTVSPSTQKKIDDDTSGNRRLADGIQACCTDAKQNPNAINNPRICSTISEKVIEETPDWTSCTNYSKPPDIRPKETTDIGKNRNADSCISKVSSVGQTRQLDSHSKEKLHYPNASGTVDHRGPATTVGKDYRTNTIDTVSPSTQKKIYDNSSGNRRLAEGIQACCTDAKQNRNAINNPRICSTISEKVIEETPYGTSCTNCRKQPNIRPRETDISKNRNADPYISKVSSLEKTRKLDSHSKEKMYYPNASGTVGHRGPATTVGNDNKTNTIDTVSSSTHKKIYDDTTGNRRLADGIQKSYSPTYLNSDIFKRSKPGFDTREQRQFTSKERTSAHPKFQDQTFHETGRNLRPIAAARSSRYINRDIREQRYIQNESWLSSIGFGQEISFRTFFGPSLEETWFALYEELVRVWPILFAYIKFKIYGDSMRRDVSCTCNLSEESVLNITNIS